MSLVRTASSTPMPRISSSRPTFAPTSTSRRSHRSSSAPANGPSSEYGRNSTANAPAIAHGGTTLAVLVVIGLLCSAITAFVYVRLIVLMYFSDSQGEVRALTPSLLTTVGLAMAVILTIGLGVMPAPVLDLADQASQFIR